MPRSSLESEVLASDDHPVLVIVARVQDDDIAGTRAIDRCLDRIIRVNKDMCNRSLDSRSSACRWGWRQRDDCCSNQYKVIPKALPLYSSCI